MFDAANREEARDWSESILEGRWGGAGPGGSYIHPHQSPPHHHRTRDSNMANMKETQHAR